MNIERQLIESLLEGRVKAHELCGSTSQLITAFLAVGRFEELPQPYENKEGAWARLDTRQRDVVRKFNPTFQAARWAGPSSYDPLFVRNETDDETWPTILPRSWRISELKSRQTDRSFAQTGRKLTVQCITHSFPLQ